jgi:hypothetical protein
MYYELRIAVLARVGWLAEIVDSVNCEYYRVIRESAAGCFSWGVIRYPTTYVPIVTYVPGWLVELQYVECAQGSNLSIYYISRERALYR